MPQRTLHPQLHCHEGASSSQHPSDCHLQGHSPSTSLLLSTKKTQAASPHLTDPQVIEGNKVVSCNAPKCKSCICFLFHICLDLYSSFP